MKTSEVLTKARELIEKPEIWTKGEYARDESGNSCRPTGPFARCFCALGAVKAAGNYKGDNNPAAEKLTESLERDRFRWVCLFNDSKDTTHADVLALFDKAIATAKNQEETV